MKTILESSNKVIYVITPEDVLKITENNGSDFVDATVVINGALLNSRQASTTTAKIINAVLPQCRKRNVDVLIIKNEKMKLCKGTTDWNKFRVFSIADAT